MKKKQENPKHAQSDIQKAISLFFEVRGIMRTQLAQGKRLDPSAWLRIETLKFIVRREPMMREVAEHLSITAPSATSLVRGLVRAGLVEAREDPDDRRTSRLVLTKVGRAELKHSLARGQRLLGELFAPLSRSELADFTRALGRIKEGRGE